VQADGCKPNQSRCHSDLLHLQASLSRENGRAGESERDVCDARTAPRL
jgi:hypothetical protein